MKKIIIMAVLILAGLCTLVNLSFSEETCDPTTIYRVCVSDIYGQKFYKVTYCSCGWNDLCDYTIFKSLVESKKYRDMQNSVRDIRCKKYDQENLLRSAKWEDLKDPTTERESKCSK